MATAAVQLPSGIHALGNSSQYEDAAPITATEDKEPVKHNVDTVLNFFKANEDGSPPAPTYVNQPQTYERPYETHDVIINDVRGDEDKYGLDSHGFQFYSHVSREKDFLDEERIKDQYYKEVDQLLKEATGATRTFIFDHTIRRQVQDSRDKKASDEQDPVKSLAPLRGPVRRVHIDQSYAAALSRVPFHLPDDAERLVQGRVQLINVWRAIKTVKRDPLTVAQAQTVDEEDLVPVGLIYEKRKGETLSVKYNEKQRWYYKSQQSPEEVLLIKCFDNRAGFDAEGKGDEWQRKYGARAKRVPHSAFEVPGTEGEDGRESIEVRALVFHEDDLE